MEEPLLPRIFIFLRLRCGDRVLVKTRIRELRALGGLLADLLRAFMEGEVERPEDPSRSCFEYVDANTGQPLLTMTAEDDGLRMTGRIPEEYRERMLADRSGLELSTDAFIERATRDVDDEIAREMVESFVEDSSLPLQEMIRRNMDDDGRFDFELPLG